ncbi:MAG: hypothetical protein HUU55_04535 [Myxococcales bacterium]|nr:hypothetical protein [Myxococcales bacterium]
MNARNVLLSGISAFVFAGVMVAATVQAQPKTSSAAPATPQQLEVKFHPATGIKINPVTVTYTGYRYEKPHVVHPVARNKWSRATPEDAYRGVVGANMAGDADWILEGFAPGDRAAVKEMMKQPEAVEKVARFYKSVTRVQLLEVIYYGEYVVAIYENVRSNGSSRVTEFAMKKTKDGWGLTNELEKDVFYTYIIEGVRKKYEKKN